MNGNIDNKELSVARYLHELKDGSGHLHLCKDKVSKLSPDYKGFLKIENKIFEVSAWVNKGNKGTYISLKMKKFK